VSDTTVSILTPAGAGAIATVELAGPRAWQLARQLFKPIGKKPLPESPELHRFWFGKLADGDDVILAVKQVDPEPRIEVHCHGGRRVVQWVVDQFRCPKPTRCHGWALSQLIHAPTLRTASILLDQYHGAFDHVIRELIGRFDADRVAELASFAPVGRHLVEPWKVVVAGPPNVGKSSLVNALAGYQRSVVSEMAGTTRDVVTVQLAFDGWPVELADTAGLREAAGLEAEGIALAERFLRDADLVLWVMDATAEHHPCLRGGLHVINKIDAPLAWDISRFPDALRVSARTGEGIPGLAAAIVHRLVPHAPAPGAALPFTPELADLVERAHRAATREEAIAFIKQIDLRS
jgi:tRNA modification GTPase